MIEILKKEDIERVNDTKLRNYLEHSFNRLPSEYEYPQFGYFVVVENFEELKCKHIKLSTVIINGINDGLYDDINMVEINEDIVEVLVFVDNDTNISLIFLSKILENIHKEKILSYKI